MNGLTAFAALLAIAAFGFFAARRLPRYLHMLQQEDYDPARFLKWTAATLSFDKRLSLALVVVSVMVMCFTNGSFVKFLNLPVALIVAGFALFEPDPRRAAKKKLVMTSRAKRIFGLALALTLGVAALAAMTIEFCFMMSFGLALATGILAVAFTYIIGWIIAVQSLPFLLALAVVLLTPLEAIIQRRYWNEARARLEQVKPVVIGITGSFGKTSVKHILGHVLAMFARTSVPPGSTNTPMGLARVIRETMPADCKYFLAEMGAYARGSVARLCRLTPPDAGIITSIGEAHYERFKSLETVAEAKFELAEAVLAKGGGKVVVHEDALAPAYARAYVEINRARFVVCGTGPDADVKIESVRQERDGLSVRVTWQGTPYDLVAPLYGAQHGNNLAMVFALAMTLGLPPERVIAALRTVPQIKHRLEVKRQDDGSITIDDAYNANPKGFAAAVELLSLLVSEGGRRILITPGITELGDRNDEIHAGLGRKAAECADVALVVRGDRIPAFARAFRAAAGTRAELHEIAGLPEALEWLKQNGRPKDVVLFENDLPDVLERRLKV